MTRALGLTDVDGDGDLDVVFGNSSQPGTYRQDCLERNDGTGHFTLAAGALPVTEDTRGLAAGDVDGDGDPDLVLGEFEPGALEQDRLLLNDGTGVFVDETAARMPVHEDATMAIALADVDADGDLDVLVGNLYESDRLLLNDGSGSFADVTLARLPANTDPTVSMAVGDVDQDGAVDVVLGSQGFLGNHPIRLYLNDGAGTFHDGALRMPPSASVEAYALALQDLDGDGDPDLVFGGSMFDGSFVDLARQLDTPLLPRIGQPFDVELSAGPGYATSAHLAVAAWSTALLPHGIALGARGTLFLAPPFQVLPPVLVPHHSGTLVQSLPIPADPALLGVSAWFQGAIADEGGLLRLTGYTVESIFR